MRLHFLEHSKALYYLQKNAQYALHIDEKERKQESRKVQHVAATT